MCGLCMCLGKNCLFQISFAAGPEAVGGRGWCGADVAQSKRTKPKLGLKMNDDVRRDDYRSAEVSVHVGADKVETLTLL